MLIVKSLYNFFFKAAGIELFNENNVVTKTVHNSFSAYC